MQNLCEQPFDYECIMPEPCHQCNMVICEPVCDTITALQQQLLIIESSIDTIKHNLDTLLSQLFAIPTSNNTIACQLRILKQTYYHSPHNNTLIMQRIFQIIQLITLEIYCDQEIN